MKRTLIGENGELQIITNSKIKVIQPLTNGMKLVIWFEKQRTKGKEWQGVTNVWNVAIYIGELKRANKWKRKPHTRITGDGSLEALRMAKDYIKGFANGWIHYATEMQIKGLDKKRYRAYKFLTRYDGFICDDDALRIHYRNPNIYKWEAK